MPDFLKNVLGIFKGGTGTANTTPETLVQPAPLRYEIVPEEGKKKEEPEVDVLARDRARGTTISPGIPDPEQERRDQFRDTMPTFMGDILFGIGDQPQSEQLYPTKSGSQSLADMLREDGLIGFITEGFRSKMSPTREELGEQIFNRYTVRTNKGDDVETALNVAIQDVINETPGQAQNVEDLKEPGIELTEEEQDSLFWVNALEDAFAVLDAPIFLGTTKPVTKGGKEVAETAVESGAVEGVRNYTTKILEALKDKTRVSRQFIEDLLRKPDIKQAEKDIVEDVLRTTPEGRVDVSAFAEQVEERVLPLKPLTIEEDPYYAGMRLNNAPDDAIYFEKVYESPIQTQAGDVHWGGISDNYFGHTRAEDIGETRRILEVQSDLFQRGRLAEELDPVVTRFDSGNYAKPWSVTSPGVRKQTFKTAQEAEAYSKALKESAISNERKAELEQLEPYKNTWWQRIVREEVKDASASGKSRLLFPTGETAMKVEGIGGEDMWSTVDTSGALQNLTDDLLKEGIEINGTEWIIRDVRDSGRFTAIPRGQVEDLYEDVTEKAAENIEDLNRFLKEDDREGMFNAFTEEFQVGSKIDEGNPIYQFYDNTLQKYLNKRYAAKQVLDEQGNAWIEVKITPQMANQPVEAFGAVAGVQINEEGELEGYDPVAGLIGAGLFAAARRGRGTVGTGHKNKVIKEVDESAVLVEQPNGNAIPMLKRPEDPTAVFYHGTTADDAASIAKNGPNPSLSSKASQEAPDAFYVGDITEAGMYGDTFVEVRPKGNVKTLGTDEVEWYEAFKDATNAKESAKARAALRAKGYDAIYAGDEIEILNPDKFEYGLKGEVTPPNTMRSVGDIIGDGPSPTKEGPRPRKDERRFVTRARALEPNMDEFLSGELRPRSTEELAEQADALIEENVEEAISMAKTGTDDLAVAVASRLIDKNVNSAREATDQLAKTQAWEQAAEIANEAARNLTAHGRAVQAATLLGRTTPEGMVRFAARTIQNHNDMVRRAKTPGERTLGDMLAGTRVGKRMKEVPELTAEQAESIADRMREIEGITDEIEKAMRHQELDDEIKALVPDSLYKKIITLWKAGLLTGLKTTGLNIASNTAHFASEIVKDVPASLVDRIASIFTGKRTLATTTKGMPGGLVEGARKGWRYWKTGFDERDIGAKLDYRKVNFGNSNFAKALQTYEETVFRTIGSQDQPFYYAMKARSISSQAIADAINKGLKGDAAKQHVEKILQQPTDDMLKYAVLDAETAVFQNRTTLGRLARQIQNAPGGEIVLPFGKTPSAVATQIINYSPVGLAKTIIENIAKGKFDQRLFSQGIGRGLTGTAPIAIGMALYQNDMLTLGFPSSQREREQWEFEGRTPNSIYVGGEWRNVAVLGPLGLLLVIGGHTQNGLDQTGSIIGGLAQSAAGFGNTLTEQSFLKGMNQAIEAIQDPERSFNGFASSLAGSIIPTISADISRSLDRYERRTSSPGERLRSRIPGVRQGLEPRVGSFGNQVETQDFWTVFMDPTRPGNATAEPEDEPLVRELRRLMDAGYPATPTSLGPRAGYESLTPEQNTYLQRVAGTVARKEMETLMRSRSYRQADDQERSDMINDKVREIRVEARARTVLNVTKGMSERELRDILLQMKDDGLLTKQVFKRYQELERKQ